MNILFCFMLIKLDKVNHSKIHRCSQPFYTSYFGSADGVGGTGGAGGAAEVVVMNLPLQSKSIFSQA